jgi:hypothetical protein
MPTNNQEWEGFWKEKDEYGYSLEDAVKGGDLHDIEFAKKLINPKLRQEIRQAKIEQTEEIRKIMSDSSVWDSDYVYLRKARLLGVIDKLISNLKNNDNTTKN